MKIKLSSGVTGSLEVSFQLWDRKERRRRGGKEGGGEGGETESLIHHRQGGLTQQKTECRARLFGGKGQGTSTIFFGACQAV